MTTVYLRERDGRYGRYRRAVERAGGRTGTEAARCGALLLPGGGDLEPWRYGQENTASRDLDPARDEEELRLLEAFASSGRPVLGVCRGLQTINVRFGGTLCQDVPGHGSVDGADRLHRVRTAPSPLRDLCGGECAVNSAHHQAVDRLGSGLVAVQWAEDGVVEALCHRSLPIWAVQWHPERLAGPLGDALFRAFLDLARRYSQIT